MTRTIKASELKPGQTVSSVTTLSCNGRDTDAFPLFWLPAVAAVDYAEQGERGGPTVYLTLSGDARPAFHLIPDDVITVED